MIIGPHQLHRSHLSSKILSSNQGLRTPAYVTLENSGLGLSKSIKLQCEWLPKESGSCVEEIFHFNSIRAFAGKLGQSSASG